MKNVLAFAFESPLSMDDVHAALRKGAGDVAWRGADSEVEGKYVWGMTADGVEIRFVPYRGGKSVELYFPTDDQDASVLSDADKQRVLDDVAMRLVPVAGGGRLAEIP
jgi:hypothetical protein